MSVQFTTRTQDTLGKVIKKPPLTEKLLSKPPFRYLHDIFTEVIKTTGFLKGLFTEYEMKSDNVKDKDAKISFLQKAIDVVVMAYGEPLSVKPARIVAGHEPEKTNELLQAIGKCCLNRLSSDDAVRRVLAGEKPDLKAKTPSGSKSQGKENRERKDDDRRRLKDKEHETSRDRKEKERSKEQGKPTDKEKDRHKDSERREKGKELERDRAQAKERDREKDRNRGEGEKDKSRDVEKERIRGEKGEKDKAKGEVDKDKERTKEKERNRDKDRVKEKREKIKERERSKDKDQEVEKEKQKNQRESPVKIPRPSSAKGQRRKPKSEEGMIWEHLLLCLKSFIECCAETGHSAYRVCTGSSFCECHSFPSRRIPRPGSARPAPPRVKKQESTEQPPERIGSGKHVSNVIVDKNLATEEDDDEQFVVEEAVPELPDMPEMEPVRGLVKKILETKKDYESSKSSLKSKEQDKTIISETTKKKEREHVAKEIEKLRTSIQTLCRSALPLGKIMDYIQEDMDSMQNELTVWRKENKEHAASLLREQSITDTAVEPLKVELTELEQLIKDQQDKICAAKANILKNEEKIQKMISSINFSRT
uniref:TRAF3-interacting protein 1 n=1 Tax=Callorhinchus milii TaxID=7868 RepID=A0A4W3I0S9_CALMI